MTKDKHEMQKTAKNHKILTESRSDDLCNHVVETTFARIVPKTKTIFQKDVIGWHG